MLFPVEFDRETDFWMIAEITYFLTSYFEKSMLKVQLMFLTWDFLALQALN